jgi:glutamine synthetase
MEIVSEHPVRAVYIWIDGQRPTAKLRSKERILYLGAPPVLRGPQRTVPSWIPEWGFDGSSTEQATTAASDCMLKPVYVIENPIDGPPHVLVLCEVYDVEGRPHPSNTRARLRRAAAQYAEEEPLVGVEQEYTLYDKDGVRPLRWPEGAGFPAPQGRYYCGVGSDEVYGRALIEAHTEALLRCGIRLFGTNAEVMPAQWEFQLGPLAPLELADQLWLSRWILYRLGEDLGITVKLDPKPIAGDWNGAGAHTNFSTKAMRESGGIRAIIEACEKLARFHEAHIAVYGADNDKRLTGKHETCPITEFRYAIGDRGASVRIPAAVAARGSGYLEDRRPAANMDPYLVFTALLETICGSGFVADAHEDRR